jgi:hypothetical protein
MLMTEEQIRDLIANTNLDLNAAQKLVTAGQCAANQLECARNSLGALRTTSLLSKSQANAVKLMEVRYAALTIESVTNLMEDVL